MLFRLFIKLKNNQHPLSRGAGFLFMNTKIIKIKDCFRTPEFPLAVCLLHFGFPVETFDKDANNPTKLTFVFLRNEELEKVVEKFWKKELVIEPTAFYNISRELKSRMRADEF